MAEQLKIFGIKELDDFFTKMSRSDQRRLILDSYRMGTKPLIQVARANLRSKIKTKSTRTLQKSIGFVASRSRGKTVFVSAKVGARRFGNYRGYHGHLYDAGTGPRQTASGHSRGRMPASHFFTMALQSTEKQIINSSRDNALAALDKLISKKLKKINL